MCCVDNLESPSDDVAIVVHMAHGTIVVFPGMVCFVPLAMVLTVPALVLRHRSGLRCHDGSLQPGDESVFVKVLGSRQQENMGGLHLVSEYMRFFVHGPRQKFGRRKWDSAAKPSNSLCLDMAKPTQLHPASQGRVK